MRAAQRLKLVDVGWTQHQQEAWNTLRESLTHSVITSYRDRRLQACLFTDASKTGWAYVITQCPVDELDRPWDEQHHEVLAVNSGKFKQSSRWWAMPCKEAYPIRRAVERHRHLLMGDVPFASVNDHKSLSHVFDEPSRVCTVSVAARDRLRRWAEYLRSFTFQTVHVPGSENHLCDLLSRNGCTTAASRWQTTKEEDPHLHGAMAQNACSVAAAQWREAQQAATVPAPLY